MLEGLSSEVKWDDVDIETFLRLIQFIYTGDYSVAVQQNLIAETNDRQLDPGSEPEIAQYGEPTTTVDDRFPFSFPTKKEKKKQSTPGTRLILALDSFSSLSYSAPEPRSHMANAEGPFLSNKSAEISFETSLVHASLYVLAEKWGIGSLK